VDILQHFANLESQFKNREAKIGWFPSSVYPDGMPVASIAFQNEMGGTIKIPAHDVTVYRKINSNGSFAKNGRFVKRKQSNFATTHHVKEQVVTIPPRPFIRNTVAANHNIWAEQIAEAVKNSFETGMTGEQILELAGLKIQGDIRKAITHVTEPILAKSTLANRRRRGNNSTKPLEDSGYMRDSLNSTVGDKE
jgi:hypothetical protein